MALFKKRNKEKNVINTVELDIDTTGMTEDQIAALEAEAVLQKYDRESAYRNRLSKGLTIFTAIVLIAFSVFQLYTSINTISTQLLRAYHLSFVLFLTFILYPPKKGMRKDVIPWYDWVLAILALVVVLYIPFNYEFLVKNMGNYGMRETIVGVVGILIVMEACRRVVGLPILIIVSVFLLYTKFGSIVPGMFGHRGYTIPQISSHMFFTLSGIFGTPLGVSSTFIFLFILFGAFLEKTGVGKLFIDLANAIAGKRVGGPAKVAVISSALQGTVSGSSVANTVGTGSFTIPAMKRMGYKPEFAGAVEAAASTGGQLMPPIMGAAAFLMAEMTGFTYGRVVLSAVIPAILYFSGILISVHHEARKLELKGLPDEEMPRLKPLMKESGHLLLPLAFMIYILAAGLTPTFAAIGAILTSLMAYRIRYWAFIPTLTIVFGLLFGLTFQQCALISIGIWLVIDIARTAKKEGGKALGKSFGALGLDILDSMRNGARNVLSVAVACAMAGMIVGAVTLTGLGLKFATGLAQLAGNNIFLMMFFTMLASIVLGMGVPTTANYLITSTVCAPAIIGMLMIRDGVTEQTMSMVMSAHLFVFYFGIVADITPPVALAAMAGSAIAKGDPFKTGVTATRIAIGAFIVPYIFVLNPAMLLIDVDIPNALLNSVTALLGMYALSGGLAGFVQDDCTWYERILLIGGGMGMIIPGWQSDLIGFLIVAAIVVVQKLRVKRNGGRRIPLKASS